MPFLQEVSAQTGAGGDKMHILVGFGYPKLWLFRALFLGLFVLLMMAMKSSHKLS